MLFSLSYQTPLSKFGLKGENNMPVTIVDIAKEAGCSAATVSLVMKNSPKIKSSTKQRVMEIANRLGYTPNFAARSLINGQTNLIGAILPNLDNPLFATMVSGVEKKASELGYSIILGISSQSLEKEKQYMQMLSERRVDGLLLFPSFLDELFPAFIEQQNDKKIPVVLCGTSGHMNTDISYVKCDNHMGAYIAIEHLIKIGKKRIACLCAVIDRSQANSRISGYRDALEFYDVKEENDLIIFCSQAPEDIARATEKLVTEKKVDAIFCLYDHMSITVMRTVQQLGKRIPEDIAIVGYDNISVSALLPISLTTIDTHATRIGSMATELLIKKIREPNTENRQISLKPVLVVRESTVSGMPRADD